MGVTERTFYPALLRIISEKGGAGVTEVEYNSVPDIEFDFAGHRWLLSVKIGETPTLLKDAFLQYLRHKEESGVDYGLLLGFPESIRKTRPREDAVLAAVRDSKVAVLVDAGSVKDEYRDRTFADILDLLRVEVAPLIARGGAKHYPLPLVISFLQTQVVDVMSKLALNEEALLRIVTDRKLLSDLGRLTTQEVGDVGKFLAAYILLSQVLFLRLFAVVHTGVITGRGPMTRMKLRAAFNRVLDINYRPIYDLSVLEYVPDKYIRDTFDLIWGLEVERVRYELPGRIFHALMPPRIRKLLAAFYTRPQAAEILARLCIGRSDNTVFDPASGSGTILVAAYRAKLALHERTDPAATNPHKRFCEDEIFGADIMPFAVHLTSANLAAMDVAETIERTQIIQGDSIDLVAGRVYSGSLQLSLFKAPTRAKKTSGEEYEVTLDQVDVVLMNPPFTKVERRIGDFVNMVRFKDLAGGEVGLWGHFIFLADQFLENKGTYGAVLPINVLRGRESARARRFLLKDWTIAYIIKPTRNYGFSEWAEYRDILLVARKEKPTQQHRVKFCLLKRDLTALSENEIDAISRTVKTSASLRSPDIDIDSHPLEDLDERFVNLMWFCGVSDLAHRDTIVDFIGRFEGSLEDFPEGYFREGYRPVPEGVSQFMFLTRNTNEVRIRESFLNFNRDDDGIVEAHSPLGAKYRIEKDSLVPTLRTPVGLQTMDVTGEFDYVARRPYKQLPRVLSACGFSTQLDWKAFWANVERELQEVKSNLVVSRRINPYSPNTHLTAFVSSQVLSSSNQLNVILESDALKGRAICVLLNSALFHSYFFLLKEESTGRYIDIRFYDLYQMQLFPPSPVVDRLQQVFVKYRSVEFPALRHQFDQEFDDRYDEFWAATRRKHEQMKLLSVLKKPIKPARVRTEFDLDVAGALGVKISKDDLVRLYDVFVKEMMITRGLTRD